jgi:hypothetical protein
VALGELEYHPSVFKGSEERDVVKAFGLLREAVQCCSWWGKRTATQPTAYPNHTARAPAPTATAVDAAAAAAAAALSPISIGSDQFSLGSDRHGAIDISNAGLQRLFEQIESNVFGMVAGFRVVGHAVYPAAAMFNHSCSPNCRVGTDTGIMSIYTIVPTRRGEELTIA